MPGFMLAQALLVPFPLRAHSAMAASDPDHRSLLGAVPSARKAIVCSEQLSKDLILGSIGTLQDQLFKQALFPPTPRVPGAPTLWNRRSYVATSIGATLQGRTPFGQARTRLRGPFGLPRICFTIATMRANGFYRGGKRQLASIGEIKNVDEYFAIGGASRHQLRGYLS
jgi:hypothetical protein